MIRIRPLALVAALLVAGPALAGPGHGKGHGHGHGHGDMHEMHEMHGDMHGPMHGIRIGEPNPHGPDWRYEGRHDNGLHLGQRKHAWARGERLPRVYLEPRYYIRDYREYRLVAPPPGMVWVRPYPEARNFYLVQAATGLISQILGH